MDYISLVELGISFVSQYLLPSLTKAKAPAEVLNAVSATVDALVAHKNDIITKQNLESQRG